MMNGHIPRRLRLRARETPPLPKAYALQLRQASPTTTATPNALDTCGFISANSDYPLTCHPGQKCAKDPARGLVGCCWSPVHGTCVMSTRCLDMSQSELENVFDGLDMVCMDVRAPYCKTDVLSGDPEVNGYSLYICDTDKTTETVFRYTTTSNAGTTSLVTGTTATATPIASVIGLDETSHASSTPISTVIGAVVGSLGALAAAGAALWAFWQLKKNQRRTVSNGNPPS